MKEKKNYLQVVVKDSVCGRNMCIDELCVVREIKCNSQETFNIPNARVFVEDKK